MDETVETRIFCIDVEVWRADPGHCWSGQAERTVQWTAKQTGKGLVRQADGDHRGKMKINIHSGKHEEKYSQDQNLTVALVPHRRTERTGKEWSDEQEYIRILLEVSGGEGCGLTGSRRQVTDGKRENRGRENKWGTNRTDKGG